MNAAELDARRDMTHQFGRLMELVEPLVGPEDGRSIRLTSEAISLIEHLGPLTGTSQGKILRAFRDHVELSRAAPR